MGKVNNFIDRILGSKILVLIIVLVSLGVGVFYVINKYQSLSTELAITKQNEKSLNDSLRVTITKVGDLAYAKQILVVQNAKDLKDLNLNMYNTFKEFQGKIHELTTLVGNIKHDTVQVTNTEVVTLPDGSKSLKWDYSKIYDSENSRYIAGTTNFAYDSINKILIPQPTLITKDDIKFNLTQGLRTTKDGKLELFASSRYPDFSVSELNSVMIDPQTHPALTKFTKKQRFKLGVYGGYGITANLTSGVVTAGPQIGAGAMYTFW